VGIDEGKHARQPPAVERACRRRKRPRRIRWAAHYSAVPTERSAAGQWAAVAAVGAIIGGASGAIIAAQGQPRPGGY